MVYIMSFWWDLMVTQRMKKRMSVDDFVPFRFCRRFFCFLNPLNRLADADGAKTLAN